jgi:broad specificity phosphatase PhoE
MKTVYFVRHGESESNAGSVNKGPAAQLTPRGYEQAAFIAERAAKLPVETIMSSQYPRAMETARIIAERIGVPVEYDNVFRERVRPSEQIGLARESDEFKAIDDAVFSNFGPGHRFSNEENFDDLRTRAGEALRMLENHAAEHILLVGHGLFARVLLARALFGGSVTSTEMLTIVRAFKNKNTGLSVLRYGVADAYTPWEIVTWNDHAHLG